MKTWPRVMLFSRARLLAAALLLPMTLPAQDGLDPFRAEPSNLYDWRAMIANPAIGAFQHGAFEIGFKIDQLGFADEGGALFKAGYTLLNLPRRLPMRLNLGVQTQLFTTPLYRETGLHGHLSRRIGRKFSLGVSLGMNGLSYNQDNFDLVDPDDPVFADGASRWNFDVGAGITVLPAPGVVIGAGVRHLNQPDISLLGDGLELKPVFSFGVSYSWGRAEVVTLGSGPGSAIRPQGYVQMSDDRMGFFQAGMQEENLALRGRLHVAGPISVGYGFSYPLGDLQGTSSGSHETSLTWEFDRIREIPALMSQKPVDLPFAPATARIGIVPQFVVGADADAVDVFTKRIIREVDPDIAGDILARLTPAELGILDSSLTEAFLPYEVQRVGNVSGSSPIRGNYTPAYRRALDLLRKDLQDKPVEVVIVAPDTDQKRALNLGQYLKLPQTADKLPVSLGRPAGAAEGKGEASGLRLPPRDQLVRTSPSAMTFTTFPITEQSREISWTLVIETRDGVPVERFVRKPGEDTQISWNFRDRDGKMIKPGFYTYYIEWQGRYGQLQRSAPRELYARELQRNIHLRITRKYEKSGDGVEKVGVVLKR